MTFSVEIDKTLQYGQIKSNLLDLIRENFSIANPAYGKNRFTNSRFIPRRQYVITPTGKFDIGLYGNILKFLNQEGYNFYPEKTINEIYCPQFNNCNIVPLNLSLRQYQEDSVNCCLAHGRGVVVLPTGAGKTLTIATLINSILAKNLNYKFLLIVPTIQLIRQTYSDFIEYGISPDIISKWSGDDNPNLNCNIIIAGLQILQSQSSLYKEYFTSVNVLLIDECHKLRKKNEFNDIVKLIKTTHKFGFTGTLPPEIIDQWNIIGKLGPVLYEKQSIDLRSNKQITNICIQILIFNYYNSPKLPAPNPSTPTAAFDAELEFIINSKERNDKIAHLCSKTDKNTLVVVERIAHGEVLFDLLQKVCTTKQVYFIQGSVDVNVREQIRTLMEEHHNVVCIAISKIFAEGINIKNLHFITLASSGKAKIKLLQTIGRGVRLHPLKNMLHIFDIADNLRYGNKHLKERIQIYETEKIQYKTTEIQIR